MEHRIEPTHLEYCRNLLDGRTFGDTTSALRYRVPNPLLGFALDSALAVQIRVDGRSVLELSADKKDAQALTVLPEDQTAIAAQSPNSVLYLQRPIVQSGFIEKALSLLKMDSSPERSQCIIALSSRKGGIDTTIRLTLVLNNTSDGFDPVILRDLCRDPLQFRLALHYLLNQRSDDESITAQTGRAIAKELSSAKKLRDIKSENGALSEDSIHYILDLLSSVGPLAKAA